MTIKREGDVLQAQCTWTFLGANLVEWGVGLVAFVLISLLADSPQNAIFSMILGWIVTTYTLVYFRRKHGFARRAATQHESDEEQREAA